MQTDNFGSESFELEILEDDFDFENFDLKSFQVQIERELWSTFRWISDYQPKLAIYPDENPKPKLWQDIFNKKISPLSLATGVIVGFFLSQYVTPTIAVAITVSVLAIVISPSIYRKWKPEKEATAYRQRMREEIAKKRLSLLQAEEIVEQKSIKQLLCPSLKSVTNDVFELSKAITPVLTGAIVAGTIAIPLNS